MAFTRFHDDPCRIQKYLDDNNYVYTYIFKQLVDNTDTLLENSIVKNNLSLIGNIDDINQNNIINNKILQLIKTFNKISYKFESFHSPKIKINRYQIRSSEDYGKLSEFSKQENIFKTKEIKTLDIYIRN